MAPHVAHKDDVDAEQDDERHGVRGEQTGHPVEPVGRERRRGEELDVGQPQDEDHPYGQQQQPDAGIPRRRALRRIAAPQEAGEPVDAPAEDLRGEEGRDGMHGQGRADDPLDKRRATRTEQVTDHVDDDHARGRELDVQAPFQADQHDHHDGEQRQDQFVVHPRDTAQQRHRRVQHGEQMDDSGDLERTHDCRVCRPGAAYATIKVGISDEKNKSAGQTARRKNPAVRRIRRPVRRPGVPQMRYFIKICIT